MVGIAPVEPQANPGPVRPGVGAGRVASADDPGGEQRERHRDEDDGQHATSVAEPRGLAPERATEDPGPPPGGLADDVPEVHHDAAATTGGTRDRLELGRRRGVGHRAGILA